MDGRFIGVSTGDLDFGYSKRDRKFIGEETTAAAGNAEITDEPTWIVDPLDGTTNLVHGLGESSDNGDPLAIRVRSLQMTGSCALNRCGIACGWLDVCFELGFGGPWDVAGGAVTVREAGGVIFDPPGADFDITSQRVACKKPANAINQ
ncbi:hypothetical protein Fmac_013701 [Flemingia macrophylla]|uniref:Inositol-phosphate phosphatase n=1 Tax=Flemingia macrophylla TaxID=520843 RepID=A0ABD1MTV4_9FABA